MRLEQIQILNFRSFEDETVFFDEYTCLVGSNGAGKSTILTALNVFFRNTSSSSTNVVNLCKEDFHHANTADPIKITLTFKDLSPQAQDDLKHYYRQGRLIVSARATWNAENNCAEVKQYGSRSVMEEFKPYFAAKEQGKKAAELQEIYDELRQEFPELPKATSAPARETALHEYEEARPEQCKPVEGETQFFGFTKGANHLAKYIQWVYIPAVKDASSEQQEGSKGALKDLLDRTVRSKVNFKEPIAALKQQVEADYRKIIDGEKEVLADIERSLHKRLKDWSNPGCMLSLQWHFDENKSVVVNEPSARASIGEDNFLGEIARLGHGMQRSFLISLLHELASLNAADGPTLLLGFEEPELYQHPPQAQHIAGVLEQLATSGATNTQVIVSTHNPYFVSSKGFESVRVVRKHHDDKCSLVASTTFKNIEEIIAAATGDPPAPPTATMATMEMIMQPSQRELYFTRTAILVEGLEDVGYIASHLVVNDQWNEFRRLGCHFVITGGKTNMSRPLAIARELCIKTYSVFDADTDKSNNGQQKKDNQVLLHICGQQQADPMPADNLILANCAVWTKNLAASIREEAGKLWGEVDAAVRKKHGFESGVNGKNKMYVAAMMEELAARGHSSGLLSTLCAQILALADHANQGELVVTQSKATMGKPAEADAAKPKKKGGGSSTTSR